MFWDRVHMIQNMSTWHNKVYKLLIVRRNVKDLPGDSRYVSIGGVLARVTKCFVLSISLSLNYMIVVLPDKEMMNPTDKFCCHSKYSYYTSPYFNYVSLPASASNQAQGQKSMAWRVKFNGGYCLFSSLNPRSHCK